MKAEPSVAGLARCLPPRARSASASEALALEPPDKARLAQLARAIELDVIPRLIQAHRPLASASASAPAATGARSGPGAVVNGPVPVRAEIERFLQSLVQDDESALQKALSGMRARGISLETLYLDLFAVVARELGAMWDEDACDFTVVTVALGRLQRLLRELSPAFGGAIAHPTNGRRVLLTQPKDEQHSFGLSMVAEFFRRDGWDVIGGAGAGAADGAEVAHREWVDVIGFSIGSEMRLPWLKERVAAVRAGTLNADLCVLVGGPLFTLHPQWVRDVGADGSASDGREAPALAERLLAAGQPRASSRA